ncbi:Adenine nucleotide transporter BT1, chloroplastic/mitochondrial-like protein [Drosera capensis]
MDKLKLKDTGSMVNSDFGLQWCASRGGFVPGGLFASVGAMGMDFGYVASPKGLKVEIQEAVTVKEEKEGNTTTKKKGKGGMKFKVKVVNPSLRRLISGAIAGAISRIAVAPLETIRTHLMVGSSDQSSMEVFDNIMKTDGWTGLFRVNLINVIRVAPSRQRKLNHSFIWPITFCVIGLMLDWLLGLGLFAYDTVNKRLSPKPGEQSAPVPASLIAGACAGVSSTLLTYPLELVKTRLTIQRGVYKGILDAFLTILCEEGPAELTAYRKIFKQREDWECRDSPDRCCSRSDLQHRYLPSRSGSKTHAGWGRGGRQVHKNMLHALISKMEKEGIQGWYRGLGPSCMKLVPAAGISIVCYELCKRILVEDGEEA